MHSLLCGELWWGVLHALIFAKALSFSQDEGSTTTCLYHREHTVGITGPSVECGEWRGEGPFGLDWVGTFLSLATEAAHWYRMADAPIEHSCHLGRGRCRHSGTRCSEHASVSSSLSALLFSVSVSHWLASPGGSGSAKLASCWLGHPRARQHPLQRAQQKSWDVVQPLCMSSQVSVTDHRGGAMRGGIPESNLRRHYQTQGVANGL